MFIFLPMINTSGTIGLSFLSFIAKHNTKHNQRFSFFIWIVFFSILINNIHIIQVFNKSFALNLYFRIF